MKAYWLFLLTACGPSFDPPSLVNSVRILATQAVDPYAAPGAPVSMTVLAVDGRSDASVPMNVFWFPTVCFNPPGDNYYNCYLSLPDLFRPNTDIDPGLTPGPTFSFQMPPDVIAGSRASSNGDPYGLAFVFTAACAGHLEYVPPPTGGPPDAVPIGCFADDGSPVGVEGFVFSFSEVYSFADRTNTNPVIQQITFGGSAVDPDAGITVAHCTSSDITKCASTPLDVVVPASSQERDPGNLDVNGDVLGEEIYVDYYVTSGKVQNDTVILFDPRAGRLPGTGDKFYSPQTAGDHRLWAVVHDNRGGVAWVEVPVHAN